MHENNLSSNDCCFYLSDNLLIMSAYKFLNYVYFAIVGITMLYSWYLLLMKKSNKKQRFFYLYISSVFMVDVVGYFLRSEFKINQIYFYLPYLIISILYFGFFYSFDYKGFNWYNVILKFLVVLAFLSIVYFQVNEKPKIMSNFSFLAIILFQLMISLQWFWFIINHTDDQKIVHKQAFWVSCALLVWGVFALFRFLPVYEIAFMDEEFHYYLTVIFNVINILMYSLYLKGLRSTEYNILRSFNHF